MYRSGVGRRARPEDREEAVVPLLLTSEILRFLPEHMQDPSFLFSRNPASGFPAPEDGLFSSEHFGSID